MAIQYYADQDVKGNITLGGNLIFDTGGNALITTSGGDLTLQTSTDDIFLIAQDDISLAVNGGDVGVYISGGGGTSLRYNNSQKLITTSAGVNIGFPTSAGGVLNTAGQLYIEHQGTAWNETTPGTARGSIHMDPVGSGANDTGNAITFGASDHSGGTVGDAGIYVRSDGNYGTKMYIATTDSYSLGSKTAITILQTGAVVINRSHLVISTITNSSSDTDKFLVSNNGQVQYRTGAQVLSDIGGTAGSGSTNFIPMFTAGTTLGNSTMSQANLIGNAKRVNVGARMTITGDGGDQNGGTLNLTDTTARLGIATNAYPGAITEPEASLDVGKNARIRGSLNVGETNEQYLFVSSDEDTPVGYVKMGYYGTGTDYDLSGGAQSSVQYTSGFSNGGKVCEDERIMTFKLTRTQMGNLVGAGQKTLIAQDSNFNYIVKEAYMYQVNSGGGEAPLFSSYIAIQYQSSHGGVTTIDNAFELSSTILNQTKKKRKVLVFDQKECAQVGLSDVVPRAAVVLMTGATPSNTGSGTVDYYLRLRVKNIDYNDDIKNNSQLITVT